MKKLMLIMGFVSWFSFANAGSVLWNGFTVADDGVGGRTVELQLAVEPFRSRVVDSYALLAGWF